MASFERVLDVLTKILCILVLVGQTIVLDAYFFHLDYSGMSPYLWVTADVIVVVCWVVALLVPEVLRATSSRRRSKALWVLNEMRYAYVSWLIYGTVLCIKLNHMFFYFAEKLVANPQLYSSTSLKLIISLAGIAFLLLVYCHHREIREENYKQIMEKISLSACLDILDCLMLLNILFVNDVGFQLTYRLDRTVRAFSCICILLPTFPLLVLRILQRPNPSMKWYSLSFITQTALYFIFVNVPLFSIRLHLWVAHEIDISTFFTKNVIMLFKGAIDIVKEVVQWYRKNKAGHGEVVADEGGQMLEERAPTVKQESGT